MQFFRNYSSWLFDWFFAQISDLHSLKNVFLTSISETNKFTDSIELIKEYSLNSEASNSSSDNDKRKRAGTRFPRIETIVKIEESCPRVSNLISWRIWRQLNGKRNWDWVVKFYDHIYYFSVISQFSLRERLQRPFENQVLKNKT